MQASYENLFMRDRSKHDADELSCLDLDHNATNNDYKQRKNSLNTFEAHAMNVHDFEGEAIDCDQYQVS
jgi:hypothetical protein